MMLLSSSFRASSWLQCSAICFRANSVFSALSNGPGHLQRRKIPVDEKGYNEHLHVHTQKPPNKGQTYFVTPTIWQWSARIHTELQIMLNHHNVAIKTMHDKLTAV